MKTIRRLTIPAGILLMYLALAATGARAQDLFSTHFAGKFTLPFMAQWGMTILPPGEYNLYYGYLYPSGTKTVEIRGQGELPHSMILARRDATAKGTNNVLICVREGDKAYVSGLELAAIGESAQFALPHGVEVEARILAGKHNHTATTQVAEMRISIAPAPVK